MCGIAGVVTSRGTRAEAFSHRLLSMQRELRHRGPDGSGAHFRDEIGLVHTRLALLDREGGAQPMASGDGRYLIVYNGEIYNHADLRSELRWPFATRSDTETVLAACAAWGPAALSRLDGMFSFFFWDTEEKRGFAARDRLGVKPLVYASGPHGFAFASEAKALVAGGFSRRRASEEGILEYLLTPHVSIATSPFADVNVLPPGSLLHVTPGSLRCVRWWQWQPRVDPSDSVEDLRAELSDALAAAVPAALQADVPVGIFLSGGLDSSAIAGWAARGGAWCGPAFSLAMDPVDDLAPRPHMIVEDDLPFAREVAVSLGLPLREVPLPRESLLDRLQRAAVADDALPAWEQELSQQALAEAAAREVKAVLVGDAADETHYGYRFLLGPEPSPASLTQVLGGFPVHRRFAGASGRLLAAHESIACGGGEDLADDVGAWEAMTRLTVERWLPRLLHNGDIHTMAASLEARVPFASPRVLEVASRVGAARAIGQRDGKRVLREAASGICPESVRTRVKSSLPKDPGAGRLYRMQTLRCLPLLPDVVRHFIDVESIERMARTPVLTESEQSQLFRFLGFFFWAHHYEVEVP